MLCRNLLAQGSRRQWWQPFIGTLHRRYIQSTTTTVTSSTTTTTQTTSVGTDDGAIASFLQHGAPVEQDRYVEALKKYAPKTPGTRHRIVVDRSFLWKGGPIKQLTIGLHKTGGRNNTGRITVRGRSGGHKRLYRFIDFVRAGESHVRVERLEYDPNRSAFIALVKDLDDGLMSYILAPKHVQGGDELYSGEFTDIKPGNCLPLKNIPAGTLVHNVELTPGRGGQMARSAGTFARVINAAKTGYATLKLSSGEHRLIPVECRATIGIVSNTLHKQTNDGKAGVTRWRGRKPVNRGVSRNPVDHPMGGGEGKSSGGRHPVSRWGKLAKGGRTRKRRNVSDKYIVLRRWQTANK